MRVSSEIGGMAGLSAIDRSGMTSSYTRRVRPIALLLLVMLGASACGGEAEPVSFGGPWQATPIAVRGPILETIDRVCRASFPDFPQETRMVVIDARGAGRVDAHYVGPNGVEATCFEMTVDDAGRVEGGGGATQFAEHEPPLLQPLEITNGGGYVGEASSLTLGRVGAGIVKVVIFSAGQPPVTPSLMNGWYLAWIPGEWAPGAKAVGFDAAGRAVSEARVPE